MCRFNAFFALMLQIERLTLIASDRALIRHVAPAKMVRESKGVSWDTDWVCWAWQSRVWQNRLQWTSGRHGWGSLQDEGFLTSSLSLSIFCGKWAELPADRAERWFPGCYRRAPFFISLHFSSSLFAHSFNRQWHFNWNNVNLFSMKLCLFNKGLRPIIFLGTISSLPQPIELPS